MIKTKTERVGTCGLNSFGSKMEVTEYNKVSDIWVKFENGNVVHTNWKAFIKGEVRNVYDKSVYGSGFIGEGEHRVSINSKNTYKYNIWNGMLRRCYDEKFKEKHPSYIECSVVEEWLNFQNFADWFDENYYEIDGERMELDKDILIKGNKIYSPESSIFVPQRINVLFVKREVDRGKFPIGVSWDKKYKKYLAYYSKGKGERETIGYYETLEDAFTAYKKHKEQYIKKVAQEYKDTIPNKLYNALIKYVVEITD